MPNEIRVSPVIGSFYPEKPEKIIDLLERYMHSAVFNNPPISKVAVVPHAGLVYSGIMSLRTLKWIQKIKATRPLFVLLGPSHYELFNEVAIDTSKYWSTPLGKVKVDYSLLTDDLMKHGNFRVIENAFVKEHSLDIILLILQYLMRGRSFNILPMLISDLSLESLSALIIFLKSLLQLSNVYLFVSTDLSHYPTYKLANLIDMESINTILLKDANLWMDKAIEYEGGAYSVDTIACGKDCVYSALLTIIKEQLNSFYVGYYNAGDIDRNLKNQVVGYTGILFGKYTAEHLIVSAARFTLDYSVRTGGAIPQFPYVWQKIIQETPPCKTNRTFVSIYVKGRLRGCIGNIVPRKEWSLLDSIVHNTIMAAFRDPRFMSMHPEELIHSRVEVSLLGTQQVVDNYKNIKLGKHGIVLQVGSAEAVFLPEVPIEQGWNIEETLKQLSIKAGLPADAYKSKKARFYVFESCKIKE